MRFFVCALTVALSAFCCDAVAQEEPMASVNIHFNTRFDFLYENPRYGESSSGFHGRYFNLMVWGDINRHLSYSFRQRFNKRIEASDIFSATDWIHLTYKPTENWAISGGKQVVAIGGYEYDAAPIDIYYSSMFWQNIACYAFGVSGKYISDSGDHSIMFQFCNSPYQTMKSSCFAYNLMWTGRIGCWNTIWSANLMETSKGRYAGYIALGNRFDFGRFSLELDLMQRSYQGHQFWLDDYSVIAKADWRVCRYLNVFAKGGYERFHPGRMGVDMADEAIEEPFYGVGVEVFPIKNYPELRLHAMWNMNNQDGCRNADHNNLGTQQFIAGATWRCNIFSFKWNKK